MTRTGDRRKREMRVMPGMTASTRVADPDREKAMAGRARQRPQLLQTLARPARTSLPTTQFREGAARVPPRIVSPALLIFNRLRAVGSRLNYHGRTTLVVVSEPLPAVQRSTSDFSQPRSTQ